MWKKGNEQQHVWFELTKNLFPANIELLIKEN